MPGERSDEEHYSSPFALSNDALEKFESGSPVLVRPFAYREELLAKANLQRTPE
jgi:hypothetical protein